MVLALKPEEKQLLAQILYREGVSEEEIQKIFGVAKSTVYAWLEQIKEQEKQEKIKKALELREKGWTQEEIARELGVTRQTISSWLSADVKKFQTLEKFDIFDKEVGKLSPEFVKLFNDRS